MKIIELLNKIANGEEVPKKIMFLGNTYRYDEIDETYRNIIGNKNIGEMHNLEFYLNDEVEIIEEPQEHKIPEKLNISNFPRHNNSLKKTAIKINEILDYLEEIE